MADAHLNLAQGLLRSGNFAEGWAEYEWRWQRKGMAEAVLDQPRWTGSPLTGRAILLRSEQGFGDLLQFVRYADLLHRRGGTVIVESPPALASLMRSCPGVDRVVVHGEPLGEFDVHVPLLSVPGILGTSLEAIPAKVPYLWPMQESIERWREELAAESRLKIGIAWQGNPANLMDAFRSVPLAQFAAIARMRGVQLYSLQSGAGREQLAEVIDDWPIIDFGDRLGDFHNTAALMRNLDLVISCDSARPTWPAPRRPGMVGPYRRARLALDAQPPGQSLVSDHAAVSPNASRRLGWRISRHSTRLGQQPVDRL